MIETHKNSSSTGSSSATPAFSVGTVNSGSTPAVTITGTPANPVLNFTLKPGDAGAVGASGSSGQNGQQGIQGVSGSNGKSIYAGNGVPASNVGAVGDLYIDASTGDLYQLS